MPAMRILIITLIRKNLKKIKLPIKIPMKSKDQTERILLEKTTTIAHHHLNLNKILLTKTT